MSTPQIDPLYYCQSCKRLDEERPYTVEEQCERGHTFHTSFRCRGCKSDMVYMLDLYTFQQEVKEKMPEFEAVLEQLMEMANG